MQTIGDAPSKRLLGRYSYPTSHRVIEISAVLLFIGFGGVFSLRLASSLMGSLDGGTVAVVAFAVLAAALAADFASGLVHALCDNLGSVDTPVVGQKFIRSFREHHTDPLDMTRGDFIRVNADNFLICLPILIPVTIWLDVEGHPFLATFLVSMMGFVVVTNQIHKWAHTADVPRPIRWAQAHRLILSPEHHRVHHTPPYDSHYCITSGITNRFLTGIGFWPALMRVCHRVGRIGHHEAPAGARASARRHA